ncbi:hypothetical protein ACQ4PT_038113 [Festuca glaucescens]
MVEDWSMAASCLHTPAQVPTELYYTYGYTILVALIHQIRLPHHTQIRQKMAGGDELKLLGSWLSPFATRVKLALTLKGLSYAEVEEDLCNKSELLLRSNPVHKKVPVLIHNGIPVCESVIIMQYIDEAFAGAGAGPGPSLLPSDPHERAVARF